MGNVLSIFKEFYPKAVHGQVKPHKFALLLAIIELYKEEPLRGNAIYFNSHLEELFKKHFTYLAPEIPYLSDCFAHPLIALQTSQFYFLHIKNDKKLEYDEVVTQKKGRFTKSRIQEILSHATLSNEVHNVFSNPSYHRDLEEYLVNTYKNSHTGNIEETSNLFVSYLNSLQRIGGSNENSLAESQACDEHFASIHVSHPLAEAIYQELTSPNGQHVILTGHAGDGKSTIALEVYKLLQNFDCHAPLETPLKAREDIASVSIIKDLSERNKHEDSALIAELLRNERRFLLVSNTGALLDFVTQNPRAWDAEPTFLESDVLDAISQENGEGSLSLSNQKFRVFNLAHVDNLDLARTILEKMLASDRWKPCTCCIHSHQCPFFANITIMQAQNGSVLDRIFLAYRRMYEYGTRLTMRQFTEHFAYMITAGLSITKVKALFAHPAKKISSEYFFFNRFFGDNGWTEDHKAMEMAAIQGVLAQKFGERPYPAWEHRLWLKSDKKTFSLGVEKLEKHFDRLRHRGARSTSPDNDDTAYAREQVRRMIYFFFQFEKEDSQYLKQYLNSFCLLDWQEWQKPNISLSLNKYELFDNAIFHVLQEHFTGLRLPESSIGNESRRLYSTLNRHRSEIRQSAQVVLAHIEWSSSTKLNIVPSISVMNTMRRDLVLCGKERIAGVNLVLKLPVLDYIMMRHFGDIGEILKSSYRERLDRFKAEIHDKIAGTEEDSIMLIRLKTNRTFLGQKFSVKGHRLEVTNAL